MPFKNEAHRRAMWANAPEVARKWEHKYGSRIKRKKRKKRIRREQ